MSSRSLIRNVITLGGWTLVSRGAGFARDVLMANYLGAGAVADALLVAQSLPNMFRRFFAEGAFNTAFVPLYSKKLEAGEDAGKFAQDAFNLMAWFLLAFSILGTLAMPALVYAMAAGFSGDARFDLAVAYGEIGFSYILFVSLVALISGVLVTKGRFTEAGFVPVLMNLAFIAAMLLAKEFGWDMGLTLAWTLPLTGLLQFGYTWFSARRSGQTFRLGLPRWTPDLKRLFVIAGPALLAGGVVQINLIVGRQVASQTEGAVAWLAYADRLYQLPLGVVGIAIGTALLPALSRALRAGNAAEGQSAFNRGSEFALALTLPAAVALVVIALPLCEVLYQRGAFGPDDTANTAIALAIYGLGLPAFVLQKVLQPLFYAREDTRRPFNYALTSMVVNAALAIGLMPLLGFAAAAIATTVSGWIMAAQLWRGSRAIGPEAAFDSRMKARLWRIIAASLAMGVVLWLGMLVLGPMLGERGLRVAGLALLITAGILSYFGIGGLIGAFTKADLKAALRRKKS
ncbi:murein biosynthesis integral membrane protein MurJ [Thioclava sp. FR2]|uniref:murein biosynthesis integral membrane protein MurJ n=1 Tax=Thioclava sp. FR2 TaxID=3445780 RepID=UPI003EC04FB8